MAYLRKKKPFTFCFTGEGEAVFSNSISLFKSSKGKIGGHRNVQFGESLPLGTNWRTESEFIIERLPSPKISMMEHQDNSGKPS